MPEQVVVGRIEVPIHADTQAFDAEINRDLARRAEQAGDQAGNRFAEAFRGGLRALAGVGLLVLNAVRAPITSFSALMLRATTSIVNFTNVGLLHLTKGLRQMGQQLKESETQWRHLGAAIETTAGILERVAKVLLTVQAVLIGVKIATAVAAARMAISAHRAAAEFTPAWNRVLTLLEDTGEATVRLRGEVSRMAGEIGVAGAEAANTFYQILSALPRLAKEPAEAMEILRVSLEAGATGFTDAATAAEAITAIMEAFNLEAKQARRVSDALFAAQDQGVLTFGEIAESIGRVSGLAHNLGVSFEEVLAVAARLTPTGLDVNEVFTQLRGALNSILSPSQQAAETARRLGLSFNAAALQGRGLVNMLEDIFEATGGDIQLLSELFTDQRSLSLIVALNGQIDQLRTLVEQTGNAAGNTADKFELMNQSAERQREIFRERFTSQLREVGVLFEELGIAALKGINLALQGTNELGDALTSLNDLIGRSPSIWEILGGEEDWRRIDSGVNKLIEFTDRLERAQRKGLSESAVNELSKLILEMEKEIAKLPESSQLRDAYNETLRQTQVQLQNVTVGMENFAAAVKNAASAERDLREEARLRREELEWLIFGQSALSRNQQIPGVSTPRLIPRPEEPTSLDFSRFKIEQATLLAQAKAVEQFARTGDLREYERAIRAAQEAVNDLVIAEAKRLREAGVEEDVIAELLQLYRVMAQETDQLAEARKRLGDQLTDQAFAITATAAEQAERSLDRLVKAYVEAGGRLEDVDEQVQIIRRSIEAGADFQELQRQYQALVDQPPTPAIVEALENLRDRLNESREVVKDMPELWEAFDNLLQRVEGTLAGIRPDALISDLQQAFERRMLGLRESLTAGLIDETEFRRQGEKAARAFNAGILAIIRRLREEGALTDELYKALVQALQGIDLGAQALDATLLARNIQQAAGGAIKLAEAFGLVDSNAASALRNVLDIATAIPDIVKAFSTGGGGLAAALPGFGAVLGGVASLMAGAFTDSPAERRRKEILEENNRRLQDLAQGIARLSEALTGVSGKLFAGVEEALSRVLEATLAEVVRRRDFQRRTGVIIAPFNERAFVQKELDRVLRELGLTMDDLEEVARSLGITFDGTVGSVRALLEAIRQFEFEQLFETFSGSLRALRIEFELFNIDDPVEQLERMLELMLGFSNLGRSETALSRLLETLGKRLPDQFKRGIRDLLDLDLSTEEGLASLRKAIQDIFTQLTTGALDLSDLGELSIDELLDMLLELSRLIDRAEEEIKGGVVSEQIRLSVGITEFQANRLLDYQASQLQRLTQIVELLGGDVSPINPSETRAVESLDLGELQQPLNRIAEALNPPLTVDFTELISPLDKIVELLSVERPRIHDPEDIKQAAGGTESGNTFIDVGGVVVRVQMTGSTSEQTEAAREVGERIGRSLVEEITAGFRGAGASGPIVVQIQAPGAG